MIINTQTTSDDIATLIVRAIAATEKTAKPRFAEWLRNDPEQGCHIADLEVLK